MNHNEDDDYNENINNHDDDNHNEYDDKERR